MYNHKLWRKRNAAHLRRYGRARWLKIKTNARLHTKYLASKRRRSKRDYDPVAAHIYYLKHAKTIKARSRALYKAWVAEGRTWPRSSHAVRVAANHKRRITLKHNGGSFTAAEWTALKRKYKHTCLRCLKRKKLSPDHVIPIVKGGSGRINNIQPLCISCNSIKHDKRTDYR